MANPIHRFPHGYTQQRERKAIIVPGKPKRVTHTSAGDIEDLEDIFTTVEEGPQNQEIATSSCPLSICWFTDTELAIFASGHLEIHQVTAKQTKLLHKQTCDDWKKSGSLHHAISMAVSDTVNNKIFLTCSWRPGFLYKVEVFPVIKKILITKCKMITGDHNKKVCEPICLAANSNSVMILFDRLITSSLLVCNLPDLQQQRIIKVGFICYKQLAISNELILLLKGNEVIVKSLSNLKNTLCKVLPPNEAKIMSIALSKDGLELYIACSTDKDSLSVYKYRCIGYGTMSYIRTSWHVNSDVGQTCLNGLSVADFLGVVNSGNNCVKITNLSSSI